MSIYNPERRKGFQADIVLEGAGGHSSEPYKTHSPILAGFELIALVSDKLWYEFDSFDNVLLEPIGFEGGKQQNVIPDIAVLQYYGEYVTTEQYEHLKEILNTALEAVQHSSKVDFQITYTEKELSSYADSDFSKNHKTMSNA